jgi:hypothetical protein
MTSHAFNVAVCRAVDTSRQRALSLIICLECELILRLADGLTGAGIPGFLVAAALRTGRLGGSKLQAFLSHVPLLFAGNTRGSLVVADSSWRLHRGLWLAGGDIPRVPPAVAPIFATLTICPVGICRSGASAARRNRVRPEAQGCTVHDLCALEIAGLSDLDRASPSDRARFCARTPWLSLKMIAMVARPSRWDIGRAFRSSRDEEPTTDRTD